MPELIPQSGLPLKLYDNTRVEAFRKCPRMFYFRHIRNWTGTKVAPPLIFGSAWHAAMDVIWSALAPDGDWHTLDPENNSEVIDLAKRAHLDFMDIYEEGGLPSLEDWDDLDLEKQKSILPRGPYVALEMLASYIEARAEFIQTSELIGIEKPFIVPIDPDNPEVFYVGRLDKVIKRKGRIYCIEHKSSALYSKINTFRTEFLESFSPNSQVDGYLHALHMIYGKIAKAVWIDAALVHKTVHNGFKFIPVDRMWEQLDAWLYEVNHWINAIKAERDLLELPSNKPYLACFPKKTEACTLYGRPCIYSELCKTVPDPHHLMEPPPGMKEEPWHPIEVLRLEELGITEEAW